MGSMDHEKLVTTTCSVDQTRALGQKIGRLITRGLVIALTGELGSGKTAFVQGLARGLQVPREYYITSPTFTLINEYPARRPFYHVDLYRIGHAGEVEDIGLPDILNSESVTAIEWSDRIPSELPDERLQIRFRITGENTRELALDASGSEAVAVLKIIADTAEEKIWG